MTRVALIGPSEREEVQRLALRLEERSAEPVLVDTRRPAAIRVAGEHLEACGVSLAGVVAAYVADLGLPRPRAADAEGRVDAGASRAALARSQATWSAWRLLLERLARHAAVVNPPASYEVHGLKPFEVASYLAAGRRAPATLASDDPLSLLELAARPLARGRVRKDLVGGYGYTEPLEPPADLEAARALLRAGAVMAQERVDGDAVRAFVVGGRMLVAAEILGGGTGEVDSRRGETRVRRIELPGRVAEASTAAAEHWGMAFAGVDWLRAGDRREWVLLECNSAPFFVELERRTGVDIASALADLLLRRARRARA
jgi:glutathione synthase/RimK-type ligase-like ATP-grasp enzyme